MNIHCSNVSHTWHFDTGNNTSELNTAYLIGQAQQQEFERLGSREIRMGWPITHTFSSRSHCLKKLTV